MRFKVEELDVQFPYPRIYPEQYQYMLGGVQPGVARI